MNHLNYKVSVFTSPRGSAVLSNDGHYRFRLTRKVGERDRTCCFIMLNPSTADHEADDPTIRRCMGFAKAWGCDVLHVVNLFGWRTSDPDELEKLSRDPRQIDIEGARENKHYIAHSAGIAQQTRGPVVCAWGTHGRLVDGDLRVLKLLREHHIAPVALKVTKHGDPSHPLYLSKTLVPAPYVGRAPSSLTARAA